MTDSTAVVTAPAGVGDLPDAYRQALAIRKQLNVAAAELASLNWGAKLDQPTRRAIADFCRTYNVDAATEIHVLGGNVYLNGKFYLRKLGEMVAAGKIVYAYADMIHVDLRLAKLAESGDPWAVTEQSRRQQERILHDIDDNAISACVFRVMPLGVAREITGCKAIYADSNDPVGKATPMETVETRAARRAMRQLASHIPAEAQDVLTIETVARDLSGRVEASRDRQKALGLTEEPAIVHQIAGGSAIVPGAGGSRLASMVDHETHDAYGNPVVPVGDDSEREPGEEG